MMKKRTRIVPSLVVTASFVGVIPACALGACGGATTTQDGGGDAKADQFLGVAAVAMCCFDAMGVADVGFIPDAPLDVNGDVAADAPEDAKEGG
ncbi:MAG TPA: hypothetical protein VGH87_02830 [Polyangiaceae bacterium]|jgi:hypothetical protein|nr:hypothetical protein [Polyangiaceae bacterium]